MQKLCGMRIKSKSPPSTGKFKESINTINVPSSVIFAARTIVSKAHKCIPLHTSSIQAGYPEATDDNTALQTDLNSILFNNAGENLILLVQDSSLLTFGIFYGDTLIVTPKNSYHMHDIIITQVAGTFHAQQNIYNIKPIGAVRKIIRKIS